MPRAPEIPPLTGVTVWLSSAVPKPTSWDRLFREYGRARSIFAVTATGGHAYALARKEMAIAVDENLMRELRPLRANAKFPEQREPLSEAQQREEAAIIPFPLLMQRLVDRLARAE